MRAKLAMLFHWINELEKAYKASKWRDVEFSQERIFEAKADLERDCARQTIFLKTPCGA